MRDFLSLAILLGLATMAVAGDAAYTLKLQPAFREGQVLTAGVTIHVIAVESFIQKGRVKSQKRERQHHFKGQLEVLAAEGGRWTKLAVTPEILWQHLGEQREEYSPLRQTVWITRKADGLVCRFHGGELLESKYEAMLTPFFSTIAEISPDDAFGPGKPVSVGEQWTANSEKLAAMFNATGSQLQVTSEQVQGSFELVRAEGDPQTGTLEVKGTCQFSDLLASARSAGELVPDRSAARMELRYVLPQNPELPRKTAEMHFEWAFSGRLVVDPQVRRTVKMTNIRKETLIPVQPTPANSREQ